MKAKVKLNLIFQVESEHNFESMKNEKQDLISKLNESLNENARLSELLKKNKVSNMENKMKAKVKLNLIFQVESEHNVESMKNEKQDLISKLNESLNENARHSELLKKNKVIFMEQNNSEK
jgi:hypothetical protein